MIRVKEEDIQYQQGTELQTQTIKYIRISPNSFSTHLSYGQLVFFSFYVIFF